MADTLDMPALEREHREWIQKIIAANGDLAQRMAELGIISEYDEDEDILFVTIGPPVEALTETVANCVGLRVDPDTLKLVGLEIMHAQAVARGLVVVGAISTVLLGIAASFLVFEAAGSSLGYRPFSRLEALGFGLLVGPAGQLGDLMESMIKRDCDRKDASQAIPGFGGVLDVIDSLLFAAPVAYGYWLLVAH